jgi:hypothetical protein
MIEQDVDDPARILAGSDALCRGAHRRRHHQHHAASYDGAFRDQTAAQILCIPTDTDCVVARPRDAAWAEGQSRKIASATNEVNWGILLLQIPHCDVRRQQD